MGAGVPLAYAAYKRTGFPEAVTVNCYAEKAPTKASNPLALISRPGLASFAAIGAAPVRAVYHKPGLFNGSALIVAETAVHTLSASGATAQLAGTAVTGSALVDIDAGQDADLNAVAYIATGDGLYKIAGNIVTREPFPDAGNDVGASSVCYHRGFWIAVEAGTDVFYYQLPGNTTWDALQFASAEYNPDKLKAVRSLGDMILLMGDDTVEVWRLSGTSVPPMEPYGGLNFNHGLRARDTAVRCSEALIYVDSNCQVQMFDGGEPRIISDNGLSEQIRRVSANSLRASYFVKDGHPLYVLTLGIAATWVYDLSTQYWVRFESLGFSFWRANLFCNIGDTVLASDVSSNQIYQVDADRRTDIDDPIVRRFSAILDVPEGSVPVANVVLDCELGAAPYTGQGSAPLINMRISHDAGKTFGPPRARSLGATGKYLISPRWNALGTAKGPLGAIFQFEVSDPVGSRFSGLRANVP